MNRILLKALRMFEDLGMLDAVKRCEDALCGDVDVVEVLIQYAEILEDAACAAKLQTERDKREIDQGYKDYQKACGSFEAKIRDLENTNESLLTTLDLVENQQQRLLRTIQDLREENESLVRQHKEAEQTLLQNQLFCST